MAISQEQKALRAGRIGSSDALRIMDGRWREVWLEKTGRAAAPDLEMVPVVQIGVATEHLHARFYAHRTGLPCHPAGERSYVHPDHAFLVAHLDFLTWQSAPADPATPADTVLEAKFHAGFKSDEELAGQYYWQVQHQMLVGGLRHGVLSVLRPSSYSFCAIDRDDADMDRLLETLKAFWWHVENDVEPVDPSAVPAPDFERLRVLNMAGHNAFTSLSGILVEGRADYQAFREAEAALKALMPAEARIAYVPPDTHSGGVVLSRSRDGRVTIRFGDLPRKYWNKAEPWLPEAVSYDFDEIMP